MDAFFDISDHVIPSGNEVEASAQRNGNVEFEKEDSKGDANEVFRLATLSIVKAVEVLAKVRESDLAGEISEQTLDKSQHVFDGLRLHSLSNLVQALRDERAL